MIGEDKLVHFSGVALGEACTIVLRGASALALQGSTYANAKPSPPQHTPLLSEYRVRGNKPYVLSAPGSHVLDEAERSLHDVH